MFRRLTAENLTQDHELPAVKTASPASIKRANMCEQDQFERTDRTTRPVDLSRGGNSASSSAQAWP